MTFTLAHISDPHIPPDFVPSLFSLSPKQMVGHTNWRRTRRQRFSDARLAATIESIRQLRPDHVALTGDLVNIAHDRELSNARRWLERIGPADWVSLVPGNHDGYVRRARRKMLDLWADYMRGDDAQCSKPPRFPYLRRRGPLAIIGVSTLCLAPPFFAVGKVGARQRRRLGCILADCARAGLFRVVLLHHPPHRHATHWRHKLLDDRAVRATIGAAGAELILHGHTHMPTRQEISGPAARIPVIGVSPASAESGGSGGSGGSQAVARLNLFSIDGGPDRWRCLLERRSAADAPGDCVISRETLSTAARHLEVAEISP